MFSPYSRGDITWEQHLKRIEYVGFMYDEDIPHTKGTITLSDQFIEKIAGKDALNRAFGKRYLAADQSVSMNLADILSDFKSNGFNIKALKADFFFCHSLAIDKFATNQEKLENFIKQGKLSIPKEQIARIGDNYKYGDDKKSMDVFKQICHRIPDSYYFFYKIGLIYLCSPALLNLDEAFNAFNKAGVLAEKGKYPEFASIAYVHSAFVAYLRMQDEVCLNYTGLALSLDAENWEAVLLHAKIAALKKDTTALISLQKVVKADRNYLIKIDSDMDFELVQEKLYDSIRAEMQQKSKHDFVIIEQAQKNVLELEERVVKYASEQKKFETILFDDALQERLDVFKKDAFGLSGLYKNNTFFDYGDFIQQKEDYYKRWGEDNVLRRVLREIMIDLLKIKNDSDHIHQLKERFSREKVLRVSIFSLSGIFQIMLFLILMVHFKEQNMLNIGVAAIIALVTFAVVVLYHLSDQKVDLQTVQRIKRSWHNLTDQNANTSSQGRTFNILKIVKEMFGARLGTLNNTKLRLNLLRSLIVLVLTAILIHFLPGGFPGNWIIFSIFLFFATLSAIINETIRLQKHTLKFISLEKKLAKRVDDALAKRRSFKP